MNIGQSADKDFAYILGVYLGDGCVTLHQGKQVFRLNTIDLDFAEAAYKSLKTMTGRKMTIHTHPVSKSSKPNNALRCGCDELCRVLVEDTVDKKIIPAYVMSWAKDLKIAFIAGLMDSEGFVAKRNDTKWQDTNRSYYMGFKSCDSWIPVFVEILQSVGIRIGKVSKEEPRRPGYKTPTRFTIKMQSWLDAGAYFNIARKQSRVEEWGSIGPYERRARFPRRSISEANMLGAAT